MRRTVAALVAVVALAGACGGGGLVNIPDPGPLSPTTSSTVVRYDDVVLAPVPGTGPATSVAIGPGQATIQGTVVGPEGPVSGATVLAERIVDAASARVAVATAPDGRWSIPGVLGGRYRVRAWLAPDLAMTAGEVFFLEAAGTHTLDLRIERFAGVVVTENLAPAPPVVGEPTNLAVLVTQRAVGDDGVVRAVPVANVAVQLMGGGGGWRVDTSNPTFTDAAGVARWRIRCTSVTAGSLAVVVADIQTFALDIPHCDSPVDEFPATTGFTDTSRPRAGSPPTTVAP